MLEIIIIVVVPVLAYGIYSKLKIDKLQKELLESKQQLSIAKENIKILENASKERDRINEISAKVNSYSDDIMDNRLRDKWTKTN